MAIIHGRSDAEWSLLELAREYGFDFQSIQEIDNAKKELEATLPKQEEETRKDIEREIRELETKSNEIKEAIEGKSKDILEDIKHEMENLKSEINALNIELDRENLFSFLISIAKRFISSIKRWRKRRRYNYLRNPEKEIGKRLKPEYQELNEAERMQNYLRQNTQEEIDRRLKPLKDKIERINEIVKSKEYKGAQGEVKVISQLEKLPDEFHVFNDLYLKSEEWIKFNEKPLNTAQIDHLVVGPTGVYVIETKNWSEEFVHETFEGAGYTPYDQIERASYLVYRKLNHMRYGNTLEKAYHRLASKEIKVRSIIAVCGSKLPLGDRSSVAVLFPERIPGYIQNSKYRLPEERIIEITNKLAE